MKRTWPYDMWSLGVTWLEIVMGTPHVFQVDPRTRAKLYHQLNMEAMSEVRAHKRLMIHRIKNCCAAHLLILETVWTVALLGVARSVARD